MTRRWLGSADVEIDDESGAVLVKLAGTELALDVDLGEIVAGIAGSGPAAKTLADVVAALANIPANRVFELLNAS